MKQRIFEVDTLRAIACLAVILIHTSAEPMTVLQPGSINVISIAFLNGLCKFAVPCFIFISGLTLFHKYGQGEFAYLPFLRKRLGHVLIPYIGWSTFYYLIFIIMGYYSFSLTFFLERLFIGNIIYHLYFMVIIIQFYLLFGVVKKAFDKINAHVLLFVCLLINLFFIKYSFFPQMSSLFVRYLFFFILGCYLSVYLDRFKQLLLQLKWWLNALYAVSLFYYAYLAYQAFVLQKALNVLTFVWFGFSILSILAFYLLSIKINDRQPEWLRQLVNRISAASFYIYLGHPLALMVSQKILNYLGFTSTTGGFIFNTLFIIITVIPLSILYTEFKKSLRDSRRIQITSGGTGIRG